MAQYIFERCRRFLPRFHEIEFGEVFDIHSCHVVQVIDDDGRCLYIANAWGLESWWETFPERDQLIAAGAARLLVSDPIADNALREAYHVYAVTGLRPKFGNPFLTNRTRYRAARRLGDSQGMVLWAQHAQLKGAVNQARARRGGGGLAA